MMRLAAIHVKLPLKLHTQWRRKEFKSRGGQTLMDIMGRVWETGTPPAQPAKGVLKSIIDNCFAWFCLVFNKNKTMMYRYTVVSLV